ncbi:MAG: xanthine dehydrogenase family protein subunit M [Pseudomonadota bacterium]
MRYESPQSVDDAIGLLANGGAGARVMAGGTDLLVQLRSGMLEPELVVDIKQIEETRVITEESGGFRVGAAVAGAELNEHPRLPKIWPGVAEAFDLIGSVQIQGRATMGGNLCNASPAADSVPGMIAAGAIATVAGPKGRRELPVEDVCTGPGRTSLGSGEFIVSFFLPERPARSGDAYLRFIPRTEMDIAVVGAGVSLTLDESGVVAAARVALGAVAPTAMLVQDCSSALVGTSLDDVALQALSAAASAACNPINDKRGTIEYRTKVAGVIAQRTAKIAYSRAKGE